MAGFVAPESPITSNGFVAPESPILPASGDIGEKIEPGVYGETEPVEQRLLKNTIAATSGATLPSTIAGIPEAVKGVGSLLTRPIGAALESIPATENIAPTIGDISDNMLLKSLGTRAGQIHQTGGLEAARDAAQVGREAGLSDIFSTERGRIQALKDLTQQQGQEIGNLRQQAGKASPDIFNKVKEELAAKYNPANADLYSGQAPKVEESLNLVRNTASPGPRPIEAPTNAGISQGITKLNNFATGEKLRQPVNAMTDVANNLSHANDAEIVQALGPEKGQEYLDALHKESGAFHLQPFLERGAEREAVARGGGKGVIQSLIQKAADTGGYRATSKGLNALQGALSNPIKSENLFDAARLGTQAPLLERYLKEKYGQP